MEKYTKYFVCLLMILVSSACENDEFEPKDHPFVITLAAGVNNNSVILTAEIIDLGPDSIIDHGFVWGTSRNPTLADSFTRVFENQPKKGRYKTEITTALIADREYFASAYVRTLTQEVYGNQISFRSNGSLPPEVQSIFPLSGNAGTIVTIQGKNFSDKTWGNVVSFGGIQAEVISATNTEIICAAPQAPKSQIEFITVETGQKKATYFSHFELLSPWRIAGDYNINLKATDVSFSIGGAGYTISTGTTTLFRFDPANNIWTSSLLPENSGENPKCATSGEYAFALLDYHFWRFDPKDNSWLQLEPFSGPRISEKIIMETQEKIFIISLKFAEQTLWQYIINDNRWMRLDDPKDDILYGGNWFSFSFTVQNIPYFGIRKNSDSKFWMCNPITGAMELVNNVPINTVLNWKSGAIDGSGYLALGGTNIAGNYNAKQVWEYKGIDNTWIRVNDCPVHLRAFASYTINEKMYFIGESKKGNTILKQIWEFNPEYKLIVQ